MRLIKALSTAVVMATLAYTIPIAPIEIHDDEIPVSERGIAEHTTFFERPTILTVPSAKRPEIQHEELNADAIKQGRGVFAPGTDLPDTDFMDLRTTQRYGPHRYDDLVHTGPVDNDTSSNTTILDRRQEPEPYSMVTQTIHPHVHGLSLLEVPEWWLTAWCRKTVDLIKHMPDNAGWLLDRIADAADAVGKFFKKIGHELKKEWLIAKCKIKCAWRWLRTWGKEKCHNCQQGSQPVKDWADERDEGMQKEEEKARKKMEKDEKDRLKQEEKARKQAEKEDKQRLKNEEKARKEAEKKEKERLKEEEKERLRGYKNWNLTRPVTDGNGTIVFTPWCNVTIPYHNATTTVLAALAKNTTVPALYRTDNSTIISTPFGNITIPHPPNNTTANPKLKPSKTPKLKPTHSKGPTNTSTSAEPVTVITTTTTSATLVTVTAPVVETSSAVVATGYNDTVNGTVISSKVVERAAFKPVLMQ